MALRSIAAFVAALCACGVTAIHAEVCEPFKVGIRLRVDRSISARRITDRLKNETEAIWEPYGVQFEWTDAGASERAGNSILLDATVERRRQQMESPTVLGLVVVTPDAPNWQPIRVSFDATERFLARRKRKVPSMVGIVLDRELALALGRVLAHEIGHVLLGPPYHDQAGLMRAGFRAEELAEPDRAPFRLTSSGVGQLRSRLRALTGEPHFVREQDPATLDLEGLPGTRHEPSGGAPCTTFQPAR